MLAVHALGWLTFILVWISIIFGMSLWWAFAPVLVMLFLSFLCVLQAFLVQWKLATKYYKGEDDDC